MFGKHGIKVLERKIFETPKSRLKPDDAKRFLEWCCENYENIFVGIKMRSYEEIIRKFGDFIDKYGIRELRSKFTLVIGKRHPRIVS